MRLITGSDFLDVARPRQAIGQAERREALEIYGTAGFRAGNRIWTKITNNGLTAAASIATPLGANEPGTYCPTSTLARACMFHRPTSWFNIEKLAGFIVRALCKITAIRRKLVILPQVNMLFFTFPIILHKKFSGCLWIAC